MQIVLEMFLDFLVYDFNKPDFKVLAMLWVRVHKTWLYQQNGNIKIKSKLSSLVRESVDNLCLYCMFAFYFTYFWCVDNARKCSW